jgi:AcrR family transcriptional regulator
MKPRNAPRQESLPVSNYELFVAPYKRWGSGRRHEAGDAREHLINSAIICFRSLGIPKTTVIDVAAQARVTRQTVYRYFNGQQDMLRAAVQRDLEYFWFIALQQVQRCKTPTEFLVELLVIALEYSSRNPDQLTAFMPAARTTLTHVLLADQNDIMRVQERLRGQLAKRAGCSVAQLDAQAYVASEWLVRLWVSYLGQPSQQFVNSDELRRLFHRLLPALASRCDIER